MSRSVLSCGLTPSHGEQCKMIQGELHFSSVHFGISCIQFHEGDQRQVSCLSRWYGTMRVARCWGMLCQYLLEWAGNSYIHYIWCWKLHGLLRVVPWEHLSNFTPITRMAAPPHWKDNIDCHVSMESLIGSGFWLSHPFTFRGVDGLLSLGIALGDVYPYMVRIPCDTSRTIFHANASDFLVYTFSQLAQLSVRSLYRFVSEQMYNIHAKMS